MASLCPRPAAVNPCATAGGERYPSPGARAAPAGHIHRRRRVRSGGLRQRWWRDALSRGV